MADPLSSLIRSDPGPVLPAFERFAPPPPDNLVAAEIDARTAPGDIVIELHGRGGWVARSAINRLRRVYDLESAALTRLLAEVVLRPPDLRHFDAALNTLANHPRGDVGLRQALNALYASRCLTCSRTVIVDEFIWDGDAPAPSRKSYRCAFCREQARAGEQRAASVDREDIARATAMEPGGRAWDALRARFPTPADGVGGPEAGEPGDAPSLADHLLALYTPRNLEAIEALVERLEGDLRAAPIQACLRLALLHVLLPASRLNSYPGRMAALRIVNGQVKLPPERQWRERNVWALFEEGCRHVRSFLQRLESAPGGTIQARVGEDLLALVDGSANVVIKRGGAAVPGNAPAFPAGRPVLPGRLDARSRIRLVLTQSPIRWSTENLSYAYLATSLVLGAEAARGLPLDALLGPAPRAEWGWEAAALRRSLLAVRPVLAPDAGVVVILDRGGPGNLVAGVLGGVGAGYGLSSAVLAEMGDDIGGLLEFRPPDAPRSGHDDAARARGLAPAAGPFQLAAVERAVADVAVAVLQERGEPARFERLLGEVLIGLDRLGHLRRLIGTQTFSETEERAERSAAAVGLFGEPHGAPPPVPGPTEPIAAMDQPGTVPPAAPSPPATAGPAEPPSPATPAAPARSAARLWPLRPRGGPRAEEPPDATPHVAPPDVGPPAGMPREVDVGDDGEPAGVLAPADPVAAGSPAGMAAWDASVGSANDHVKLMLEIVMGELRRQDHPRLQELEPGRWWLRDPSDIEQARLPISDRLEWAVFSLLSTSGGLSEAAFFDRVARMFRGHDTPDEELVRACLQSYRSFESSPHALRTDDDLQVRAREHGELVGMLGEYGHRLGLRVWIARREQRRTFKERPLAELLSEAEQRVYLPLVTPGPAEILESVDCIWYLRGKATFLFEVEWTAMLAEPILRRGRRVPSSDTLVRFLVVPPERAALVRLKLARSPLLRRAMEEDNWHILKSDHLRRLYAREEASLDELEPFLGLDPEIERQGQQLALFG